MKILFIQIETNANKNSILHFSYILYDTTAYKILILETYDIQLYYKAQDIFNKNNKIYKKNGLTIENNKMKKILTILNYYINMCDKIVCYDYNFVYNLFKIEYNKNNIINEFMNITNYTCLLELCNKKLYLNFNSYDNNEKQNNNICIIYIKLYGISYLYKYNHTLFLCILVLIIYFKMKHNINIEMRDSNIKRLKIINS